MPNKFVSDLVNKGVFGAVWLGFVAVISAIAGSVGIKLTANLAELGNSVSTGNLVALAVWVVSVLIFAGIALVLAKNSKIFKVFNRTEADKVEIPKKLGILTLLLLGALISISVTVFNWLLSTFGAGDADLTNLVNAFQTGNIWGVVVGIFAVIVIGFIVFAVTAKTKSIQKAIKSNPLTDKIPDGGSTD
jgi:hypothetical protein